MAVMSSAPALTMPPQPPAPHAAFRRTREDCKATQNLMEAAESPWVSPSAASPQILPPVSNPLIGARVTAQQFCGHFCPRRKAAKFCQLDLEIRYHLFLNQFNTKLSCCALTDKILSATAICNSSTSTYICKIKPSNQHSSQSIAFSLFAFAIFSCSANPTQFRYSLKGTAKKDLLRQPRASDSWEFALISLLETDRGTGREKCTFLGVDMNLMTLFYTEKCMNPGVRVF